MKASEKFSAPVIQQMRKAVSDTGGNEVMFTGRSGDSGLIEHIETAARGNENSVPALEGFVDRGDVVIHNHPGGNLSPSAADLRIASILGNQGIGFYIINNEVTEVYAVAETVAERIVPLNTDEIKSHLEPGGSLSGIFEKYEVRPSQIEMLCDVADAINNEEIIIAEAGTGVGKSLAYLIPAFQWVINNNDRIVISTGTINLQHQLIEKDIPLVRKMLKTDKKAALVKGRGNYVCMRKYLEKLNETSLFNETDRELMLIKEWVETTDTGDKSDLSFLPDHALWGDIASESDYCLGLHCPYREKCFVIKSRKRAAAAQILVVNHHILFSDISARSAGGGFNGTAVLPGFSRIVFDEAHNMENAATSFYSPTLSRGMMFKTITKIYRRKKGRISGIYVSLKNSEGAEDKIEEIPSLTAEAVSEFELLEKEAEDLLKGSYNLRIDHEEKFDNLLSRTASLKSHLSKIHMIIDDITQGMDFSPEDDAGVYEIILIKNKLQGLVSTCEKLLDTDDNYIPWFEKSKRIFFYVTPIDISRILQDTLYSKVKSIVFTSATLSISSKFSFWKKRVGLDSEMFPVTENIYKSPFNYEKNVLLGIPQDLPDPSDEEYTEKLSQFIYDSLLISEGKGLVLFTSYTMLMKVYESIRDRLVENKIMVYRQGEDDRFRLLRSFNSDRNSVLLATDSFWEGVDSPGDTLKNLIICRLPFRVPSDPVIKARMDRIAENGGNPFMDFSLPEAVIKLKQGFGRLMRAKDDRGVVQITDNRILRKQYGSIFLKSLPEASRYFGTAENLHSKIEDFLYS